MAYQNTPDRSWINYIDLNLIDIYPIQFANCDRLRFNKSVYIFDEVGSGKTISSGLMALDFLVNNENSKVLVITTNALAKKGGGNEYGQFLKDWFDKLPFEALDLKDRIEVVNNHYANLREDRHYGLVIIDEAQLFLNQDALRHKYLTQHISAERVVFLTATPIKENQFDLTTYVAIAQQLLRTPYLNSDWINQLCTQGKNADQIICSLFDTHFPATRYFKDTIMSLNVDGFKKTQAKRLLPELWEYDHVSNKKKALLDMINLKCQKNVNSRFVIFTRYVEKEAVALGQYLATNGFSPFTPNHVSQKTYYVVTGRNAHELALFAGQHNLPTVLILTYQIAEQGVNLPGFNYVVNYHISSYPSALEQRFGRIDRMGKSGSIFPEIHMCYMVAKDKWDINTANFYMAVSTYLYNLLSYLPSKNTLLSEEIIDRHHKQQFLMKDYIEKLEAMCADAHEINKVICYYEKLNEAQQEAALHTNGYNEHLEALGEDGENDLLKFCDDRGIIYDCQADAKPSNAPNGLSAKERLIKDIKDEIAELKTQLAKGEKMPHGLCKALLRKIEDKIFYCKASSLKRINYNQFNIEQDIGFVDAITECADAIYHHPTYRAYVNDFNANVKLPILFNHCRAYINKHFENWFITNRLDLIFPIYGYKQLFSANRAILKGSINDADYELLAEHCDILVKTLPFFKMCMKFKEKLQGIAWTKVDDYRTKYDFDPFTTALGKLKYLDFGLSTDFYNAYWRDYEEYSGYCQYYKQFFYIGINEDRVIEASNWYKLAYHYTREEELAWVKFKERDNFERYEDVFKTREELMKWFIVNKELRHSNDPVHINIYQEKMHAWQTINATIRKIYKCESLYHDFIFTPNSYFRSYVKNEHHSLVTHYKDIKAWEHDLWTQGIYKTLFGISFDCQDYYKALTGNDQITN